MRRSSRIIVVLAGLSGIVLAGTWIASSGTSGVESAPIDPYEAQAASLENQLKQSSLSDDARHLLQSKLDSTRADLEVRRNAPKLDKAGLAKTPPPASPPEMPFEAAIYGSEEGNPPFNYRTTLTNNFWAGHFELSRVGVYAQNLKASPESSLFAVWLGDKGWYAVEVPRATGKLVIVHGDENSQTVIAQGADGSRWQLEYVTRQLTELK